MDAKDPIGIEDAESVMARVEGRLDEVAQRFDRTDWVELAAAIVLALATIVAAWSAYQSSRWGGEQAAATAEANATRLAASTALNLTGSQVAVDSQIVVAWLQRAVEGDERGMAEFESRVTDEMRPAWDAWLLTAEPGELPPGSPLDLPEYEEQALSGMALADELGQLATDAANRAASPATLTRTRQHSSAAKSVVTIGRPTARYSLSLIGLHALIHSLSFHGMISTSMAAW